MEHAEDVKVTTIVHYRHTPGLAWALSVNACKLTMRLRCKDAMNLSSSDIHSLRDIILFTADRHKDVMWA